MTLTDHTRIIGFSLILATAACGKGAESERSDPNRPAVVQAPPLIVPGDTMKVDTMPAHHDRMVEASNSFMREYALLGAAIAFGDQRMIGTVYAPGASLTIADSTRTGAAAIAGALADLAARTSMKQMERRSRRVETVDSVYVDSGTYVIRAERAGGKGTENHGTYVARWVKTSGRNPWAMLSDQLIPAATPTKR